MPATRSRRRPLLAPGAVVAVVAPGFAVEPGALEAGLRSLSRRGYRVRRGRHLLEREGYLAGSDDARAEDLEWALTDPQIDAVWFARGGYGSARLLDRLPWRKLRRRMPPMIGFSDLTALFCAAWRRAGAGALYGPVVTELPDRSAWHRPSLAAALRGAPLDLTFPARATMVAGSARGRLLGGNLAVLNHLCGTRYLPDLRGAVLFLEEVGEGTYRVDRMLTQLQQAGALRGLAAVLLGGFDLPRRRHFPPDRALDDVLRERLVPLGVPVVRGLPAGHVPGKRTLALGSICTVDTAARRIRFGR